MCGIAGILADFPDYDLRARAQLMAASLRHRGPDRQSSWCGNGLALAHSRLSIIDLTDTGNQPMVSPCGQHVIAFNGEIYNYRELRACLKAVGVCFRGNSDTEVLLQLLAREGPSCLSRLNGIFAFAYWNNDRRELTLARDRFGAKPLYWCFEGGVVRFGSEAKALAAAGFRLKPSPENLAEYLYFGALGRSASMNEGVRRIPPGHYAVFREGRQAEVTEYWRPEDVQPISVSDNEAVDRVRSALEVAVRRQLVADVPIGIFLSGGVDSSALASFASRHYEGHLQTYSVGFDFDGGVNELPRAGRTAKYLGTDHHELLIESGNLPDVIEALVEQHDEPFGDAADIPLYLLCRQLGGHLKVVLQGDGGDEFFGGYRRHAIFSRIRLWNRIAKTAEPLSSLVPNRLRRMVAALAAPNGKRMALLLTEETEACDPLRVINPKMRELVRNQEPFAGYNELNIRFSNLDLAQRMLYVDTQAVLPDIYLEKVDKSTMAWGIEARVPFLDNDLTELALALPSVQKVPSGRQKHLLRAALRGVVPDEVLDGAKIGFGVPYGHWIAGALHGYVRERVLGEATHADSWLCPIFMEQLLDRVRNRKGGYHLLWKCLQLAIWRDNLRS
jgi:asparagine synthase (glutamine-hydrolysing)